VMDQILVDDSRHVSHTKCIRRRR